LETVLEEDIRKARSIGGSSEERANGKRERKGGWITSPSPPPLGKREPSLLLVL
jgi:hypothetical protein